MIATPRRVKRSPTPEPAGRPCASLKSNHLTGQIPGGPRGSRFRPRHYATSGKKLDTQQTLAITGNDFNSGAVSRTLDVPPSMDGGEEKTAKLDTCGCETNYSVSRCPYRQWPILRNNKIDLEPTLGEN